MQPDNRNFIIFIVVTLILVMAYEQFVLGPTEKRKQAEAQQAHAVATAQAAAGLAPNGQPAAPVLTRTQALEATPRVQVDTPELSGSISLTGGRLDDLFLKHYRQTTDPNSPPEELLRPLGAQNAYYAVAGWVGAPGAPDETTAWTLASPGPLTPGHPVDLTYAAASGLTFHRRISVDAQYMFTVSDTVENHAAAPVNIAPYGAVQRRGVPPEAGKIAMEGAIGMFPTLGLKDVRYPAWKKDGTKEFASTGGWTGITDKYWMAVFAPPQSEPIKARFEVTPVNGIDDYQASYVGQPRVVAPGGSTTETTHLFAGAKVVKTLKAYGDTLKLPDFDKAVDWGWFEILSKPVFWVMDFYAGYLATVGLGFGWAILALTITIRLVMFPAFNASYAMSTKMKKVQPEMKALQERMKGDPAALQKEMMALYAREKINPVTGCIPMLLPLPVFYALNNVFNVTIEMRHASFGWVKDLSAPDPTTIWNLFGLLPWDPLHNPWISSHRGGAVRRRHLHAGVPPRRLADHLRRHDVGLAAHRSDHDRHRSDAAEADALDAVDLHDRAGPELGRPGDLLVVLLGVHPGAAVRADAPFQGGQPDRSAVRTADRAEKRAQGHQGGGVSEAAPETLAEVFSDDEIEAARVLFAHDAQFVMGAAKIEQLPAPDLPEIAFAGRSNVGKSSLINALVGRSGLARSSSEPGRTREVNFFLLDGRIRLVDLPGYGFAKASKGETRRFQNLGRDYLRGRPNLRRVFLLIDARHGLKPPDAEAMAAFDTAAVSYQIVLTKADKLKPAEAEAVRAGTEAAVAKRPAAFPRTLAVSAVSGAGLELLRAEAARAALA